jgi:hypothetical protein
LASASASARSSSFGSLAKSSGPMTRPESTRHRRLRPKAVSESRGDSARRTPPWRTPRRASASAAARAVVGPLAHVALPRRLGADDARPPLGGSLRHQAVDNVVATATSADAATTLTSTAASGSHHRELGSGLRRGTTTTRRWSRVAAEGGEGGEWLEG